MNSYSKQYGFTLIELVITLILMSIISVVVGRLLLQSFSLYTTSQNINDLDWNAANSLERLVSDIHNIRTAADIAAASSNQLSFTDNSGNSVQYIVSAGSLLRNNIVIANNVTSYTFSYLDKTGASTTNVSAVRLVRISITFAQGNSSQTFMTMTATRGFQ